MSSALCHAPYPKQQVHTKQSSHQEAPDLKSKTNNNVRTLTTTIIVMMGLMINMTMALLTIML